MVTRIKLTLPQAEYAALLQMSLVELRNPSDQVRHLVRCELGRRGLLPASAGMPVPAVEAEGRGGDERAPASD